MAFRRDVGLALALLLLVAQIPALTVPTSAAHSSPARADHTGIAPGLDLPLLDSEGEFLCGTPLLEAVNEALTQVFPFLPLSEPELQMLGRRNAAEFRTMDALGQRTQFWADNLVTHARYTVGATLQRMTTHSYIYVADDTNVSDQALDVLASQWDGIYDTTTSVFGQPPDVDGDPRITILILDIIDGNVNPSAGYVAGYFSVRNELRAPDSNLREMFYLDANPGIPGNRNSVFTLAHEFQHMINFNYHRSSSGQATWLNEGLSDLAGFLSGHGHDGNVRLYLREPDDSLINWSNRPEDYGSAYLLQLYLWERYGGNALTQAITQHPGRGEDAVDAALAAQNTPDRFQQVVQKWTAANYLGDTVSEGGAYGYRSLTLVDGGEDNITSFRRAALTTEFRGYPVNQTGTVEHWGVRYYRFSNGLGNLNLSFTGHHPSPFGVNVVTSSSGSFAAGSNTVMPMTLDAAQNGSASVPGFGLTTQAVLLIPFSRAGGSDLPPFSFTGNSLDQPPPLAILTPIIGGLLPATPTPTPTATTTVVPTVAPPIIGTPVATPIPPSPSTEPSPVSSPAPVPAQNGGTGAPTLVQPADAAQLPSLAVPMGWSNPDGTAQYQVQVLPFNNDGPALNLIRNVETSYAVPAPRFGEGPYIMLPGMTYTWRVRVTSATTGVSENDPVWGPWASRTFRTPPPSSSGLSPAAPAHAATVTASAVDLQWADTNTELFYYEIQVSGDTRFDPDPATATSFVWWNLVHAGVTTPPASWRTPPLTRGTTYYWRVRPRVQGDGTQIAWGPVWSFSVP